MTFDAHTNFAYSTVTGAPGAAGLQMEIQATDYAQFPTPPFNMTCWPPGVMPVASNSEIVRVTAINQVLFTIVRAQEGTTALDIVAGWQCAAGPTAKTVTDIESAVIANASAITAEVARAEAGEAAAQAAAEAASVSKGGTLVSGNLVKANSSGQAVDSGLAVQSVVNTANASAGQVPIATGPGTSEFMFGLNKQSDYAEALAPVLSTFRGPRAGVYVQAIGTSLAGTSSANSGSGGTGQLIGVTNAQSLVYEGQEISPTNGVAAGTFVTGFASSTTINLSQPLTTPQAGATTFTAIRNYALIFGVAGGRYWRVSLPNYRESPGNYGLNQIQSVGVALPMLSHNCVSGGTGVTISGTWTVTTGQPTPALSGPYNSAYSYQSTAGDYISYLTPSACTAVGVRCVRSVNGGLALVSIDGSTTAANLLPTAQQLVTAGLYANTILVANGGTLNPTDTVLDCNQVDVNTTWDYRVVLADNLSSATHTIKITATGYASLNSDETGSRTYVTGFGYGPTATAITNSTVDLYVSDWISEPSIGSAWEYAIYQEPSSGNTYNWTGNIHGYEVQDSLALTIDGAATNATAGTVYEAINTLSLVRSSHIVDPQNTDTTVTENVTTYTLDRRGLSVTPNITWQEGSSIGRLYSMMPVNGASNPYGGFNRGSLSETPTVLPFNGSGDVYYGFSKSGAAWLWGTATRTGIISYLTNPEDFTNNWQNTQAESSIEDRGTGSNTPPVVTKVYFPWASNGAITATGTDTSADVAVTAGESKAWTTRYLAMFNSAGVDAALELV